MSCPLECPVCHAHQGDVGLTATGTETCTECGNEFEIGKQTLADEH